MGKTKVGKQRKDKFYRLAKETGYRSRASFKLIQLNRKFEFLQKSRVLIDLCAAPGGWLQVAQQSMPVSSAIIGVDLVSIKPLPNVITIQDDITTDSCRQALKKELKTWKVDTVLHDGAPNVGKNWLHDAFAQNQLTLSALKLASEFLVRGGWFVTKVFRSKDYNALLWVLKKLFKKVHVTKPQASRNESAEIFIVCQGYVAPDKLDSKFLDPHFVFEDVERKSETKANIKKISKPSKKAEGYEGEVSVFNKLKASNFIFCSNHLERLAECTEIVFDDEDIANHKLTTEEIKELCKDIKVLGEGQIRNVLNWRKKLRATIKELETKENNPSLTESADVVEIEEKEIAEALNEAEELRLSKTQELKRKKKKLLKERRKVHEKMNLKMIIKNDEPIIQEDIDLFRMSQLKNKEDLDKLGDDVEAEFNLDPDEVPQDTEERLQYRKLYVAYDRHEGHDAWDDEDGRPVKKPKQQVPQPPAPISDDDDDDSNSEEEEGELEFISDPDDDNDDSQKVVLDTSVLGNRNPLIVDLADSNDIVKDRVARWFDKKDFEDITEDNDLEMELLAENFEKKQEVKKGKGAKQQMGKTDAKKNSFQNISESEGGSDGDDFDSDEDSVADIQGASQGNNGGNTESGKSPEDLTLNNTKKNKRKRIILDPESLALGSLMIQSKKMRRDIIENAYNRYASNDEGLPEWFKRDEEKHNRKQIPVTAEMIKEYKEQLKAINARPVKKVVEAKARKKRKVMKRLEKARKRAEAVTENLDMTEKEKFEQLKTIYKKAAAKEDNNVTYVVAKRGVGKKVRRPAGVKGKFKVVDKRMKKDNMKKKAETKMQRKKHKSKPSKNTGKKQSRK